MDYLNVSSQIASILGLAMSGWAVWRLRSLRKLMGVQSLSKSIFVLFDEILLFPSDKKSVTQQNATKVEQLVIYLELFYISRLPWKHGAPKKLLKKLKAELQGQKLTDVLKRDVGMLRDQLFSVENL